VARFTNGWVKLYHSAIAGDIGERPFTLGLFVKLLLWANWKESNALFCGKRVILKPGQLITGLRELSPDITLDPYLHRVRNSLEFLVVRGTISQEAGNQGRLITICNWDRYQRNGDEDSNQDAIETQTERNQGANAPQLSKEYKNGRIKKEEGKSAVALPQLAQIWNENRGTLPEVRGCSGTRRKHAELRWREEPSAEYWTKTVQRIVRSPFCTGDNDRGWLADFDFLIRPETRHKVDEGKYDPRSGARSAPIISEEEMQERKELERIRRNGIGASP
jgi:hypothetical protein